MKRIILAIFICTIFSYNLADAKTITFMEHGFTYPPMTWRSLVGNEWATEGIMLTNVYWYADPQDPFDQRGISPSMHSVPSNPGIISFIRPTNSVIINWVIIYGEDITIEAYNNDHLLLDSFTQSVAGSGTITLSGSSIASLEFHDLGGTIGISTLTFSAPVPEPTTMLLLGSGLIGLAGYGRKKFFRK